MTGDWATQDIFTGIFDKVIISVLSKEDPHIQAPLCASVKLNWEWRFHFPSRWPQSLVFFSPGHRWDHPVLVWSDSRSSLDCCCDVVAAGCCFKVHIEPNPERPSSPKTRQSGMLEPRQVFCSSRCLHGNKSKNQEDGKFLCEITASCRHPNCLCDLII